MCLYGSRGHNVAHYGDGNDDTSLGAVGPHTRAPLGIQISERTHTRTHMGLHMHARTHSRLNLIWPIAKFVQLSRPVANDFTNYHLSPLPQLIPEIRFIAVSSEQQLSTRSSSIFLFPSFPFRSRKRREPSSHAVSQPVSRPICDAYQRPLNAPSGGGARAGERTKLWTENWPIHVGTKYSAYAMTVDELLSNLTCILRTTPAEYPQPLQLAFCRPPARLRALTPTWRWRNTRTTAD